VEPFVALMRRYCIDYTNVHDASVCDDIMAPSYRITISGRTMGMEEYRAAVEAAFRRYPTLVLTVHDMITSGDRLAMRFSEHGAAADAPDHVAVWPGISLYRWDGHQLLSCRVEQDFLGRDEQTSSGVTAPLEPGHPDPWATTRDVAGSGANEDVVRAWLAMMATDPATVLTGDGVRVLERGPVAPLLEEQHVEVDDLFSAGDRVAAAVTVTGRYAGGLPGLGDEVLGTTGDLPMTLLARVEDDRVTSAEIVRDRWGLVRRIRKATRG
jgi:hypothetical protein